MGHPHGDNMENIQLQRILCALMNQLIDRGAVGHDIIRVASDLSNIDIMQEWEKHKIKDLQGLATQLLEDSQHNKIEIMKSILDREDKEEAQMQEEAMIRSALYALIQELTNNVAAPDIIKAASERGNVDIIDVWGKHKEKEFQRLSLELRRYSEHEKEIMRSILNREDK